MSEIQLFGIASQRAQWLADRQTVIASNLANSSTPGYKAKDVVPFSSVLDGVQSGLKVTNARHMNDGGIAGQAGTSQASTPTRKDPLGIASRSGNSVSVEHELVKGGQVAGAYSLNTNIVKAFHKMLLMSVRR